VKTAVQIAKGSIRVRKYRFHYSVCGWYIQTCIGALQQRDGSLQGIGGGVDKT